LATVRTPCSWPPPSVRSPSPELPLQEIVSRSTMPTLIPKFSTPSLSPSFVFAYFINVSPKNMPPTRPLQIFFSNTILPIKTNNTSFLAIHHSLQVISSDSMLFLTAMHNRPLSVVRSYILLSSKTNRASSVTVSYKSKSLICKTNSNYSLTCLLFLCRVLLLCTNYIVCGASHRYISFSP
jgi:hypothetical protein